MNELGSPAAPGYSGDIVHDLYGLAIGMAANGLGRMTVTIAAKEIEGLRVQLNEAKLALAGSHIVFKDLKAKVDSALELSAAVTDYRHTHDMKGDGHIETGRAWDRMRDANAKYRAALGKAQAHQSPAEGGLNQTSGEEA